MSNIDKAAEVIEGYFPPCEKCQGLPDLEVGQCQDCAESVAHIARDLAAAGLLAPDFTGSISENEAGKFFVSKSTNIGAENSARINNPDYWGNEGPTISVNSGFLNPAEARALALALLAAADHAEKDNA